MPSAAEWSKRVAQWKRSGKSSREFALEHGWKAGSLLWWSSELNRRAAAGAEIRLVPLECSQVPGDKSCKREDVVAVVDYGQHRSEGFELEVRRGCVVRVCRGFDSELLREIVAALEVR